MSGRILIIDNDRSFVKGLRYSLEQDDYRIDILSEGKDTLDHITRKEYNMVLIETELPDINGLTLCQDIRNISLRRNP